MTTYFENHATACLMDSLRYSLVRYLHYAQPWVGNAVQVAETIRRMAQAHYEHIGRLGELIVKRRGHIASRTFPTGWTGLNDLSLAHLLPLVIHDEKQIVQFAEVAADALKSDAEAYKLVAEVLETEREHLQILQRAIECRHEKMASGLNQIARHLVERRVQGDQIRHQDHNPWLLPHSKDEDLERAAITHGQSPRRWEPAAWRRKRAENRPRAYAGYNGIHFDAGTEVSQG